MSLPRALLVSLRPHQWTKNLVVLAALAFSKHLFDGDAVVRAAMAFATFCVLSGAVYLVNDLVDLERDRLHPVKRARPIASGALPVAHGASRRRLSPGPRPALGLGPRPRLLRLRSRRTSPSTSPTPSSSRTSSSSTCSRSPSASSLRAVAGALAIQVVFSDWLLVCTILLALFLALAKRRHELATLEDAAGHRQIARRVQPVPARPDDRGGDRLVPHRLRVLHARAGDGREVPHRPAGPDHPLRDLRDLPLSLPRPPQGAGGQPERRAAHRPAACSRRSPSGRRRWC